MSFVNAVIGRHFCPTCRAVFRTQFARCPLDGSRISDLSGDPLVGTVIDGRYRIDDCIGEGAMGRVYRAQHTRMSRTYAIKVLFGDHAGDERMRSRFAREAEGVSRLSHPNLIAVVDFGETPEGLLYLVMDLAVGKPLAKHISVAAPFPQAEVVDILHQLCSGLAHAHDRGLVHRDFKGENVILVENDGRKIVKILDFGICMIVEDQEMATMLTSNGMVVGTPAMMAPEQAAGDVVDHRSDLFSLGVVLYQMLAGKLPFDGSPLDMARKNLYERVPTILERSGHHVDPILEGIVMKLLEKRPERRYQSAHEVVDDLQPFYASGSSPALRAPHFTTPGSSPDVRAISTSDTVLSEVSIDQLTGQPRRSRRLLSFAVLTIAIGCAVGLGYLLANRSETAATSPEAGSVAAAAASADEDVSGASLEEAPVEALPASAADASVPETTPSDEEPQEPEAALQQAEPRQEEQRKKVVRRPSRRRAAPKKPEPEPEPEDEESLLKQFESEVVLTSQAIERLQKEHGRDVFLKYKARMDGTGYMRAFTVSSKRPTMIRKLRLLRREVQSLLQ